MPEEMCKIEKQDDITIMSVTIDTVFHDENEQLMKYFDNVLNEGNKKIALDLSGTNYMSSVILASLVYMMKRAKEGGGNLIFCNIKPRVKEIMALTYLDKVFDIVETREEAINQLKKK